MRFHLFCIALAVQLVQLCYGEKLAQIVTPADRRPFGPYYCQARCLASCLETHLAPTLDECTKFCPPFEANTPCSSDDVECWRTCGVPVSKDQPAPSAVSFVPPTLPNNYLNPLDPNVIRLAWTSSPNASLYIVEFYPLNRQPKQGEQNFFRAMTTSLSYTVRKDDKCNAYDARVIAVNAYGLSVPSTVLIQPSAVTMTGDQRFEVLSTKRDTESKTVVVTVGYNMPFGWNFNDVALGDVKVGVIACMGPLARGISNSDNKLTVSYSVGIRQNLGLLSVSFFDDVVRSDCIFSLKIASLVTRCNTTTAFDVEQPSTPGVLFNINCNTIDGGCNNNTATNILVPPQQPLPSGKAATSEIVIRPHLNAPAHMPRGISPLGDNFTINGDDIQNMPTPPPLPLDMLRSNAQAPSDNRPVPMPPGSSISIIDSQNGSDVQIVEINRKQSLPPMCELDMLDVEPSPNPTSESFIDLTVTWLERQPLPPLPTPTYFAIRYGPIIRYLVDNGHQDHSILSGFETIVRTGQQVPPVVPDPTRHITIPSIQRNSLMKVQVCAIYDASTEPTIQWELVPSNLVDLAAVEPFLNSDAPTYSPLFGIQPDPAMVSISELQQTDNTPDDGPAVPFVITINADSGYSSTIYWVCIVAGIMLILSTAALMLVCLRRTCKKSRREKHMANEKEEKVIYYVNAQSPPPPTFSDVVKVPMA